MELPASQASSRFSLEPIPASVLADREARRRDAAVALGLCRTGCADLDEYVLLGGLERGSVVGLSAEDEEVGVQLGLQTLAHALCGGEESVTSGLVITPKPASAILGVLRDAVRAELKARGTADEDTATKTKQCLERVMLSCIFDLDGLWEVLADLDRPAASKRLEDEDDGDGDEGEVVQTGEGVAKKQEGVKEIADSQDEDDELLSSPDVEPQQQSPPKPSQPKLPDIIITTHFSSLLTGLFTHREKSAAHNALQLLSAHIRHLSRTLSTRPLVMLLNSTSSSATTTTTAAPPEQALLPGPKKQDLDPTLRSIFNPPPPPDFAPHAPRRNKPSFGLVFSQLLDLHLLCTRLPRNRVEAETVASASHRQADGVAGVSTVWVAEVLLDQMGVWEGRKGPRKDREQRWSAFNVERGRVKDVLVQTQRVVEERPSTGGFGGRPV